MVRSAPHERNLPTDAFSPAFYFSNQTTGLVGSFLPREPEHSGFVSPEEHFWKRLEEGTSLGASRSNHLWCNRVSSWEEKLNLHNNTTHRGGDLGRALAPHTACIKGVAVVSTSPQASPAAFTIPTVNIGCVFDLNLLFSEIEPLLKEKRCPSP